MSQSILWKPFYYFSSVMKLHSANASSFPLKKPSETSAHETLQQARHPSPAMEESDEVERVTCRSLKARGQEEKVRVSRFLRLAAGLSSWSPGSIDPGGKGHVLHDSSFQSGPNQSLLECCWEKHMQFYFTVVIQPQQRRNLKGMLKQSHSECMRLRRSARTFIATSIVCSGLIQLSCLPTAKGLTFSAHENKSKTTERRKQKEKLANDQHIFTENSEFYVRINLSVCQREEWDCRLITLVKFNRFLM